MPTFSRNPEQVFRRGRAQANERHHEYATLEHLLLALVDDPDAALLMLVCNVDIGKLHQGLVTYVESGLEGLLTGGSDDSKPTAGSRRTVQRATVRVQGQLARMCRRRSLPNVRATPPMSCRSRR